MSEETEWEVPGQEPEGIRWRIIIPIIIVTAAIFGGAVVIEVVMARSSRRPVEYARVPAALGKPQINMVNQLPFDLDVIGYRERREQLETLESWGWVDRARGIVHEPIDRAIDEVVRDQGRRPASGGER